MASTKVLMVLGMVAVEVVVVGVVVVVVVVFVVFVVVVCGTYFAIHIRLFGKDKCDLVRDYFSKNASGICSQRDGSGFFLN